MSMLNIIKIVTLLSLEESNYTKGIGPRSFGGAWPQDVMGIRRFNGDVIVIHPEGAGGNFVCKRLSMD